MFSLFILYLIFKVVSGGVITPLSYCQQKYGKSAYAIGDKPCAFTCNGLPLSWQPQDFVRIEGDTCGDDMECYRNECVLSDDLNRCKSYGDDLLGLDYGNPLFTFNLYSVCTMTCRYANNSRKEVKLSVNEEEICEWGYPLMKKCLGGECR